MIIIIPLFIDHDMAVHMYLLLQILELQNQLVQRGVLRTRVDLEDFGGRIDYHRGPQCIQDHLQEIRQKS